MATITVPWIPRTPARVLVLFFVLSLTASLPCAVGQEGAPPWPRQIVSGQQTFTVYSPQIEKWDGLQLEGRSAVSVANQASPQEDFGVIWVTAKTDVDRETHTVSLRDLTIAKASFPGAPEKTDFYTQVLKENLSAQYRAMSLESLQANLALTKAQSKPQAPQEVKNAPPRIFFSKTPALLVLVDGEPVLRKVEGSSLLRVINTWALILLDQGSGRYYLRALGTWMEAGAVEGPWTVSARPPASLEPVRQSLAGNQQVNMLDDPGADLKDAAAKGKYPLVYVSKVPAELIQIQGEPALAPIDGTGLLDVTNTPTNLVLDPRQSTYYALLSGRWFKTRDLAKGPWEYVPHDRLSPDFAKIPENHPKGAVLASVAGTPQAKEAVIDNSIPQTAQVDRKTTTATVDYDGQPQVKAIEGTPLQYVVNASVPVIRVDAGTWYSLKNGVWFVSSSPTGPWVVASSVPAVIYTIPPQSPLHYVTYVYVYSATPEVVVVGYTPGYYGTVVAPAGVVVYGTGYVYPAYVGAVWYPYPVTYGYGAGFAWGAATGFAFGFVAGAVWGGAWGHCCWGGAQFNTVNNITINHSNVYNQWNHNQVMTRGQDRWNSMTPQQRQQAKQTYDQRQSNLQRGDRAQGSPRDMAQDPGRGQGLSGRQEPGPGQGGGKRSDDVFAGKDGNAYRRGGDGTWERSGNQGWSKANLGGRDDFSRDLDLHQNARDTAQGRATSFDRSGFQGGGHSFGGGGFRGGGRR